MPLSQKRNLGHCLHKIFDICISVRSGPDQLEAALSVPISVQWLCVVMAVETSAGSNSHYLFIIASIQYKCANDE